MKRPRNQNNQSKCKKIQSYMTYPADFNTHCKVTVIKKVWYQGEGRHIRDTLQTDSQSYGELTCDKGVEVIQRGKGSPSKSAVGKTEHPHGKKNEYQLLPHNTHKN